MASDGHWRSTLVFGPIRDYLWAEGISSAHDTNVAQGLQVEGPPSLLRSPVHGNRRRPVLRPRTTGPACQQADRIGLQPGDHQRRPKGTIPPGSRWRGPARTGRRSVEIPFLSFVSFMLFPCQDTFSGRPRNNSGTANATLSRPFPPIRPRFATTRTRSPSPPLMTLPVRRRAPSSSEGNCHAPPSRREEAAFPFGAAMPTEG
ncbi:hypothetical protein FHS54_000129 [Sphingobium vermicomposti]|uniref:Uncharacterized protein n=1 Tax=Sphingobium vermicomposti TaxID=529005 RepID=A0A846M314_9SPHN|nr:hypothetical protein [Sphingobium vermicomposti]